MPGLTNAQNTNIIGRFYLWLTYIEGQLAVLRDDNATAADKDAAQQNAAEGFRKLSKLCHTVAVKQGFALSGGAIAPFTDAELTTMRV